MQTVNIKITGDIYEDYDDPESLKKYRIMVAKLKVICAEYDVQLEEEING